MKTSHLPKKIKAIALLVMTGALAIAASGCGPDKASLSSSTAVSAGQSLTKIV